MTQRESVLRTLAVAGGVALICSLLVSSAVYWLRPIQLAYSSIERHRAVLVAAGLAVPGDALGDRDVAARYLALEPRLVDLDTGEYAAADASMVASFDYRAAADDVDRSRDIPAAADSASLGRRPRLMPVYLLREGADLRRIVLPVYGTGMWSTIHGYIALEADLSTIANAWFYEHGETPGIGDQIQTADWLAQWVGKRAYDDNGAVVLRIGAGADTPPSSRIDAITGATVTVAAVDRFVRFWLGDAGYGVFLARLRAEAG